MRWALRAVLTVHKLDLSFFVNLSAAATIVLILWMTVDVAKRSCVDDVVELCMADKHPASRTADGPADEVGTASHHQGRSIRRLEWSLWFSSPPMIIIHSATQKSKGPSPSLIIAQVGSDQMAGSRWVHLLINRNFIIAISFTPQLFD